MPCAICHVNGHNRRTCPQNTEPEILYENEIILSGDELEDYNIFMNLSRSQTHAQLQPASAIQLQQILTATPIPTPVTSPSLNARELSPKQNTPVSTSTIEEDDESEEACCICMESITTTNRAVTKCNHVFCLTCLIEALESNKNCPLCRTEVYDIKTNEYKEKYIFMRNECENYISRYYDVREMYDSTLEKLHTERRRANDYRKTCIKESSYYRKILNANNIPYIVYPNEIH